jgi:glycosyltransferase involved in cell wall biosynthesis
MRLLMLCHNHPALQPGGTELVARTLFRELRDRHGVEGLFLAGVMPPLRQRHPGAMLQAVNGHPDEMLVWLGHFDRFFLHQLDTHGLAALEPLVRLARPDIIHLHHPLLFGVETVDLLRRCAPQAKLVFTAHDYFALCAHEGELLTNEERLCPGPTLDRCRRCFPGRPGADFVMRELGLRDTLGQAEAILVPSEFARAQYVAAGWPAERLGVMPNGIAAVAPTPPRPGKGVRRDRFGFFGHINRIKGARVATRASAALSGWGVEHRLTLNGGTDYQPEALVKEFRETLAAAPAARYAGVYRAEEFPRLIAEIDWVVMPSIWYENAPLVLMEAALHGRPVICSAIGGMAEIVRDGVDGLHAPANDPLGLADVMRRAAETPGLWEKLRANCRPPRDVAAMAEAHLALYRGLLAGPPQEQAPPPPARPKPRPRATPAAKPAAKAKRR